MPTIQETLEVPYNVTEMYELVNRIEAYSEFLPWCTESRVVCREEDRVEACLTIRGGGLSKSFTTSNSLQKDKMIMISLVNGPFRHLEGFWSFSPTQNGCLVLLNLNFELTSHLLALAFSLIFEQIAQSLVRAFSERAQQVYGHRLKSVE